MAKTRIYKIATTLDISTKEVLALSKKLGIKVTTHQNTVSDADRLRIVAAHQAPTESEITRFDGRTGRGLLRVAGGTEDLAFDLKHTKLGTSSFTRLTKGAKVAASIDGDKVSEIRMAP